MSKIKTRPGSGTSLLVPQIQSLLRRVSSNRRARSGDIGVRARTIRILRCAPSSSSTEDHGGGENIVMNSPGLAGLSQQADWARRVMRYAGRILLRSPVCEVDLSCRHAPSSRHVGAIPTGTIHASSVDLVGRGDPGCRSMRACWSASNCSRLTF
jgi:hypothetical protein